MEKYIRDSKYTVTEVQIQIIRYTNELVKHGTFLPILLVIMVIQTLQFISMGLIAPMKFESVGIAQFRIVANILYPDYYLRTTNLAAYLSPIFFLIVISHILSILATFIKYRKQKKTRLTIVTHYGFLIIPNILVGPMLLVGSTTIVCDKNNQIYQSTSISGQCYTGYHLFLSIISAINILYSLACTIYMSMFYVDSNPFKQHYFSTCSGLYLFGRFAIKAGISVFIVVDPNMKYNVLFIVVVAGLNLANLVIFKFMWVIFRNWKIIQNFEFRCQVMIASVLCLFIPLLFIHEQDNILFVVSIFFGLYAGHKGLKYFEWKQIKSIENYLTGDINSDDKSKYEILIYILLHNTKKAQKMNEAQLCIIDLVKSHHLRCQNIQCICQNQPQYVKHKQSKLFSYQLIKMLIDELCQNIKNGLSLEIIKHQLDYYLLDMKHNTVYEVSKKINSKTEQSQLVSILNIVSDFNDKSLSKNTQDKHNQSAILGPLQPNENHDKSQMYKYKIYSERIIEFQSMMILGAETCKNFWSQIIQQDCQINKILRLVRKIKSQKQKIQEFYTQILQPIFPNCIETMSIYLKMMIQIFQVPLENLNKLYNNLQLLLQTQRNIPIKHISQGIQFQQNSEIVTCFASEGEGIFRFNRISKNVWNQLGIHDSQLLGEDINQLIPQTYRKIHTEKIKQYMQKCDADLIQIKNTGYIINSRKEIIKVNYIAKLFPSLNNGIEFISFLEKQDQPSNQLYLMYCYEQTCQLQKAAISGAVLEIDHRLRSLFFGKDSNESEQQLLSLNITQLIPQWCISTETFELIYGYGRGIANIQIAKSVQLEDNFSMKIAKITLVLNEARRNTLMLTQNSYPSKGSVLISQEELIQTSPSKGQFFPKLQIKKNNKIKAQHSINQLKTIIIVIGIILIIIHIIIVLQSFIQKQRIISQENNYSLINHSGALCDCVVNIPVFFKHNQPAKIQMEVDSCLKELKSIELISNNQKQKSIANIQMKVIDNSDQSKNSTLKEAASLYLSKSQQYLNPSTPQSQYSLFFVANTLSLHLGITQLLGFDEQISLKISKLFLVELALKITQSIIYLILFVLLGWWIRSVTRNLYSTLEQYQKNLQTKSLIYYKNSCEDFISEIMRQTNIKLQGKTRQQLFVKKLKSGKDLQQDFEFDEADILMQMRNKVKFQKSFKFQQGLKRIIVVFSAVFMTQLIFYIKTEKQSSWNQNKTQFLTGINFSYSLDKIIYLSSLQPTNSNNLEVLKQTEEYLTRTVKNYDFQMDINVGFIAKVFSEYRTNMLINGDVEIFSSRLINIQQMVRQYFSDEVQLYSAVSRDKDRSQKLALRIISCLLIFIIIFLFVVQDVRIMIEGIKSMVVLIPFHTQK